MHPHRTHENVPTVCGKRVVRYLAKVMKSSNYR